jgi:hypothetical protein
MSEIGESIILPKPQDKQDEDLYNVLTTFVFSVTKILNGGILFQDNFDCKLVSFTSNATPDTEDTIAHGLGRTPTGYLIYSKDKAGILYDGGTAFDATNLYLKCNVASVALKIIVF